MKKLSVVGDSDQVFAVLAPNGTTIELPEGAGENRITIRSDGERPAEVRRL